MKDDILTLPPDDDGPFYENPVLTGTRTVNTLRSVQNSTRFSNRMAVQAKFDHIDSMRRSLARGMADKLVELGMVQFTEPAPVDDAVYPDLMVMHARLTAVAPEYDKTMEARVQSRAIELAKLALDYAAKQVSNWGSYYGRHEINKSDVYRFLSEAREAAEKADWSKLR